MDVFEKVIGNCEIRGKEVEIVLVNLKKSKSQAGTRTPVRCQNSHECSKSSFCRFVNPLTTRVPVDLARAVAKPGDKAGAPARSAEAS